MATKKKTTIKKHGAPMAELTRAGASADVIPPNRVVPSATSRPVVAPLLQADNTLIQPDTAPMVHKKTILKVPVSDSGHETDATEKPKPADGPAIGDIIQSQPPGPPVIQVAIRDHGDTPAAPTATGPTVAELLSAKRHAKPEDKQLDETAPPLPAAKADKPAEPKGSEAPEEPAAASAAKPMADIVASPAKPKPDVPAAKPVEVPAQPAMAPADQSDETAPATDDTAAAPPQPAAATDDNDDPLGLARKEQAPPAEEPQLYEGHSVLVVHEPHPVRTALKAIFLFIFLLALALLVLNFLLDAGVVSVGQDLPHTDLLEPYGQDEML